MVKQSAISTDNNHQLYFSYTAHLDEHLDELVE